MIMKVNVLQLWEFGWMLKKKSFHLCGIFYMIIHYILLVKKKKKKNSLYIPKPSSSKCDESVEPVIIEY